MNWIWIEGPKSLFPNLRSIDGLDIDHADFIDLGTNQRISAEATDAAVTAIEAIGLTVDVEKTDAEALAYMQDLLDDDIGIG